MNLSSKLPGILVMLLVIIAIGAAPACSASGSQPTVSVSDVTVSPSAFMPGDTGTITVTITNPQASLSGDSSQTTDSYTYAGAPGMPAGATGRQVSTTTSSSNAPSGDINLKSVSLVADTPVHVISNGFNDYGVLGMGNSAKFTFTVKVDDNAADSTYFLTLKVRTGDDGVYLNYPIALHVDSASVKMIINDAPASFTKTSKSVTLDLFNLRPNQVTGVSVVPAGGDFNFKPHQEYVVGSIGAGEMYTVQFDVSSKNGSYNGDPSFKVVYQNGDNWHETAPVTVYSDHSAAVVAPASGGSGELLTVLAIIVVVLLVIGGAFVFMRSKRAKR